MYSFLKIKAERLSYWKTLKLLKHILAIVKKVSLETVKKNLKYHSDHHTKTSKLNINIAEKDIQISLVKKICKFQWTQTENEWNTVLQISPHYLG